MQINLSGNRFISFIKLSNIDIGRFYKISAISQY